MLYYKLIILYFGLKSTFCSCHYEKKLGFENIRLESSINKIGKLPTVLNESSGQEYDAKNDLFFGINDSGNPGEIISYTRNGELKGIKSYSQLKNTDWEDITSDDAGNIYVGDFGNNNQSRRFLFVYKISENSIDTIKFHFADQEYFPSTMDKNFDCEAFFWFNHKLYLFSKNWNKKNKPTKLYEMSENAGSYALLPVASINLKTAVTAADISPDHNQFALMTYGKVLFFGIENGEINFKMPLYCRKTRRKQTETISYIGESELSFTNEQGDLFELKLKKVNLKY